jgi:hypothetical protein
MMAKKRQDRAIFKEKGKEGNKRAQMHYQM